MDIRYPITGYSLYSVLATNSEAYMWNKD